jgi:hypothetical protein
MREAYAGVRWTHDLLLEFCYGYEFLKRDPERHSVILDGLHTLQRGVCRVAGSNGICTVYFIPIS